MFFCSAGDFGDSSEEEITEVLEQSKPK